MASETPSELTTEAAALIHRLLEGNLAEDGVSRLSDLITSHREIARLYLSYMHLHRLLPRYVAAQDLILADDDLNATMILPALVEEDMEPLGDGLLADEGIAPPSYPTLPRQNRWKKWGWAAAVLLPILTTVIVYKAVHQPTLVATQKPTKSTQVAVKYPTDSSPDNGTGNGTPAPAPLSKATLADTLSATWSGDQTAMVGAHLPSQVMNLRAGLVRLRFDNNVIAIVRGPAVFEVKSDMQMDLKSGSVSVEVPPNAHNFAVVTPWAKVADLGTEFGVVTAADIGTHIEVFQGKVEASALAAQPGTNPQILSADQAVEVPTDGSAVHSAALKREDFVRSKEFKIIQDAPESAYHRWLAFSYQLRHDPLLALYYSFETSANTDLVSNAALASFGQFELSFSDQLPPVPQIGTGRWPDKSAVVFDASRRQRLSLKECPLSKTGKLTLAAWVNASSRPSWATIAKSRGDSVSGQFSVGLNGTDGDLVARVCQADGTDVEIREGKQNPIPLGQWVFAAMVADGDHLRLYRNGVEVASAPCTDVIANPAIHSLSIGFQPANDGVSTRRQTEGYWNGAIDELALFHRPLSAAELEQMYEAGKPD